MFQQSCPNKLIDNSPSFCVVGGLVRSAGEPHLERDVRGRGQDAAGGELGLPQDLLRLAVLPGHVLHPALLASRPQHLPRARRQALAATAQGHERQTGERERGDSWWRGGGGGGCTSWSCASSRSAR